MVMSLSLEQSCSGSSYSAKHSSADYKPLQSKIGLTGQQVARNKEGNSEGLDDLRGA